MTKKVIFLILKPLNFDRFLRVSTLIYKKYEGFFVLANDYLDNLLQPQSYNPQPN